MTNNSIPVLSHNDKSNRLAYLLPLLALTLGILFDRLMFAPWLATSTTETVLLADRLTCAFWLCCLGVVVWMGREGSASSDWALWIGVAGCAALCLWFFVNNGGNAEYAFFARLIIPMALMTVAQYASGLFTLKDTGGIFAAFMGGWFYQPFSGLGALAGAINSLITGGRGSTLRKALVGLIIAIPLLAVILPLLSGADWMFGYYLEQIARNIHLGNVALHIGVSALAAALFFSFLWNLWLRAAIRAPKRSDARLDGVIWGVILTSIILVYGLFCAIQFAYLFARAGLPAYMTYAAYAREGFAQTVAVCAINMALFGMCLRYSQRGRVLTVLLSILLALTAVMLCSGFARLKLYIDAYGMTWLRLVAGWFIFYLAAVAAMSAARLRVEKIPLMGYCALLLLVWFLALGFANPDAMIAGFNAGL